MHILVFIDPNVSNDFPVLPQLQKACHTMNFVRNFCCFWVLNLSPTLLRALAIKIFETQAAKILPAPTFLRQLYSLSIFVWNLVLNSESYFWLVIFFAEFQFGIFWTLYVINFPISFKFSHQIVEALRKLSWFSTRCVWSSFQYAFNFLAFPISCGPFFLPN